MNSTALGRLLLFGHGFGSPAPTEGRFRPISTSQILPLTVVAPADLAPMRAALENSGFKACESKRATKGAALGWGILFSAFVLLFVLFALGFQRVRGIRRDYQLSQQVRIQEREIHRLQQNSRNLEAFVAMLSAREAQRVTPTQVSYQPRKSGSKTRI